MNVRILVEKKESFDIESQRLKEELSKLYTVSSLKVYNLYDLFNIQEEDLERVATNVLSDSVTDIVHYSFEPQPPSFALEYLPGQYDQRADSAEQCIELMGIKGVKVKTGTLYQFGEMPAQTIEAVKHYLINPIEKREKDLSVLSLPQSPEIQPVLEVADFVTLDEAALKKLHQEFAFSFDLDDLIFIQEYFQSINRNPTETELKVLDTYWSDHCRHTTFETEITRIEIGGAFQETIQKTYDYYLKVRKELGVTKPVRMMDLATIMGKYFIKTGKVTNIEVSEEVNACSIEIEVDEDGKTEEWLLMFKNETHNHPTEVEPFGGASTCIGGAIRDPLSGRAFVYQAMRITGSANPLEKIEDTLEGKLPQQKITQVAAKGYSSYGNQIGLATTYVKELYDPGYKAKRMEVGFVAGAVKKDWVRRESPIKGDRIILLGGRTGRDGVGGATGSSKVHDGQKLTELSSEVQKGNAPVERKIQRLFKQEEVIRMIKKCNDFGAGGVSVAIGEISDGVRINLDVVPTKYEGLNGTELAISESQERMAVVVEAKDIATFIAKAEQENLEAVEVAEVTDDDKITIWWSGQKIVELDRAFLDTNGVRKVAQLKITDGEGENPFQSELFSKENYLKLLADLNHTSQKGLIEEFDANVGRGTVLAPLGGKYQLTPEDVSVQKIPTKGFTHTVSMASFGYNPKISRWSCYHGGYFAVIDSVAKIVAAGGQYSDIRLTFQEYFERLREEEERWGKPFASLLGTIEAQKTFGIPAIGGKDSMSGSYQDIDVPPTLISFAVSPNHSSQVVSSTLKGGNTHLYVIIPPLNEETKLLETSVLKELYDVIRYDLVMSNPDALSMKSVTFGGIAETLSLMAFGNKVGLKIQTDLELMKYYPGAIILESKEKWESVNETLAAHLYYLGQTQAATCFEFNKEKIEIEEALQNWQATLEPVFPSKTKEAKSLEAMDDSSKPLNARAKIQMEKACPKVVIPVFAGTNSEYDSQKAFEKEGAEVEQVLIRNLNSEWLADSLEKLVAAINTAEILFIPGGFSAADEPEGSGKFIATILRNKNVKEAIHAFLERKGLILGICNGFQALVKSGLLPTGRISDLTADSPTLFYNDINRHVSQMVRVKVAPNTSPWLTGMQGKTYWMPVSHGEGKFVANQQTLKQLQESGQIATQYVDLEGNLASQMPYNPNGSVAAIEGITSPCGQIYGRMGHPERVEEETFKNIPEVEIMNIFRNAIAYFKGE